MNQVRPIKMCLNETYSKVRKSKNLSDNFVIQNGLKQGDALPPLLFNFVLEYVIRKAIKSESRLFRSNFIKRKKSAALLA
jgi:hypothetical protein